MSKTKAEFVTKEFKRWLDDFKSKYGKPTRMTPKLLADFFDHLGFKDKAFSGLPDDVYDPTYNPGTKKIEDYMRKRIEPLDEKPAPPLIEKTKTRTSPTKAPTKIVEDQ